MEFQKNIYFCFIDYAKAFDCVDHNKLQKILKEIGVPYHLTRPLRNQYAGQEATVRTGHGTTNWFQIGKGQLTPCILTPCLFNGYAECIMQNTGLNESQAAVKTARRNNNRRYADDTTLMAESEEELRSLLMRVKEESEKSWLETLKIFIKLRSWHPVPSLNGKQRREKWKQWQILFSWAPKSLQMVTAAMKLKQLLLGRKAITNLNSILKSRDITLPTKVLYSQSDGISSSYVRM